MRWADPQSQSAIKCDTQSVMKCVAMVGIAQNDVSGPAPLTATDATLVHGLRSEQKWNRNGPANSAVDSRKSGGGAMGFLDTLTMVREIDEEAMAQRPSADLWSHRYRPRPVDGGGCRR